MNQALLMDTDILVVGGGVGGCAAAMAAASLGWRVILTEETDWIGGQFTAQAVPPDENRWIEQFGCTRRYRRFRDLARQFYRDHYPLRPTSRRDPHLNPGAADVSRLCLEPRVALLVLESMLAPWQAMGRLQVRLRCAPVAADVQGDRVRSITFQNHESGNLETITARYVLDATELGDLLPMTGTEYVSGAESQSQTGEPHALAGPAQPDAVQALTWCFPLAYDPTPGADHTIDPPTQYSFWRSYVPQMQPAWSGPLLAWEATDPFTLEVRKLVFLPQELEGRDGYESLWRYRRILAQEHFEEPIHEVTLVNWPQNDYWLGNIIDKPAQEVARHLESARQLSLSLIHWMQTEAPRPDGGAGYPGLYLVPEMVGTADGLAKTPYIRESRRIRAVFTVTESHVGAEARGGINVLPRSAHRRQPPHVHAEPFDDSVGIGHYRIDLHPDTAGRNYLTSRRCPFRSPGARYCRCVWRTSCRRARTSAPRTSPTAATACTRWSGTSARRRGCWRRSAWSAGPGRAACARTWRGCVIFSGCSLRRGSSWPGPKASPAPPRLSGPAGPSCRRAPNLFRAGFKGARAAWRGRPDSSWTAPCPIGFQDLL
ncbi:MAG TPA: FAD-dependent oxidoreductase [Phycisphaeraceae bacterium]